MVVKLFDWLVRLAPSAASDLRAPAARETFRQVCLAARAEGRVVYAREVGRELLNVAGTIVSAYAASLRRPRVPLTAIRRDLFMATRSLRAGGATTALAVVTLALGIGVNAGIFSVLDAVVFTSVPFSHHERLVEIANFDPQQKMSYTGTSRAVVDQWRTQSDLFDRVEAYETTSFVYETSRGAEMIAGAAMTPNLFGLLGVAPAMGRPFVNGDGAAGGPRIAIVNDMFWRQRLGSTPDLESIRLQIDGQPYAVVGVMPRSFRFPSGTEQVWIPFDLASPPPGSPVGRTMTPLARLALDVPIDRADREANARGSQINTAAGWAAQLTATIRPLERHVDDATRQSLWILAGAVAFVFLIVCANVVNLALTRTLNRTRELATCAALGASPSSLLRSVLIEHALLAAVATGAGALIAAATIRVAVAVLPDAMTVGSMHAIALDVRVLMWMVTAGTVTALVVGLPPAIIAARGSLAPVLGSDGRTTSGSRAARGLRSALVIGEVAVSVVLLASGAMMTRSFLRLTSADHGFRPTGLVSIRLGLPAAGYADVNRRNQAGRDVVARFAKVPFVEAATVGNLPTASQMVDVGTLEFEADPGHATGRVIVPIHEVPSDYFSTLGVPVVDGRAFGASDPPGAVVVSQTFASTYFGGNAVGRRFRFTGKPWRLIVGVAADPGVREGQLGGGLLLYYPTGETAGAYTMSRAASTIADFRNIVVRTSRPDVLIDALPAAVADVDSSIVIWKTSLVEHELAEAIARPRVMFMLLGVFAVFGLLLAMAGLYGVLGSLVAQRRRELGIRLALGASTAGLRRLVIGNGLTLCGIGMALGLVGVIPAGKLLRSVLYEVGAWDPIATAGSMLLLLITAMFACWWPAKEASKTDPTALLRGE